MSKDQIRGVLAVLLIGMGMFGLYSHIEYAGWVLFFGLVTIP